MHRRSGRPSSRSAPAMSAARCSTVGGRSYAPEFKDLKPLTNGASSFEPQTRAIEATVREFGLDFAPLFAPEEPARVEG